MDVLASPAPHVPPVVDEAADVEVRGVHEPAVVRKLTGGYGISSKLQPTHQTSSVRAIVLTTTRETAAATSRASGMVGVDRAPWPISCVINLQHKS